MKMKVNCHSTLIDFSTESYLHTYTAKEMW